MRATVHGIYLADWSSGTVVRGNIVNQASLGLLFMDNDEQRCTMMHNSPDST